MKKITVTTFAKDGSLEVQSILKLRNSIDGDNLKERIKYVKELLSNHSYDCEYYAEWKCPYGFVEGFIKRKK